MPQVVIDTNIALDMFVFDDPASRPLLVSLRTGAAQWIGTEAMRDELNRALTYPNIQRWMVRKNIANNQVMESVKALFQPVVADPVKSPRCRDVDDQKFIDLAVSHRAALISRDKEVLRLAKPLLALGVVVSTHFLAPI
jgi:putative PIN family toxin of toxin-antitoxin system